MCSGDRTQRRPARASSEERRSTKSPSSSFVSASSRASSRRSSNSHTVFSSAASSSFNSFFSAAAILSFSAKVLTRASEASRSSWVWAKVASRSATCATLEATLAKAELSWTRTWLIFRLSLDLVTDDLLRAVAMRFFVAASCRAA